jgi:S1-C subfamily serine protease
MLYITTLTIALPKILTQSLALSDLGGIQEQKLQQQLRSISIKVLAHGETIGSGVLLHRQRQIYTAITNAHVIQSASAPFQLQTPDGQVYAAALISPPSGKNRDLSVLRFQSQNRATATPKLGDRVWSSGFPLVGGSEQIDQSTALSKAPWGLEIVSGQITQILPISISGGYRIGSDQVIRKGMSGGPLINKIGEIVGINGVHANPLWDTPVTLENGTKVSDELQDRINNSSWAIPINFVEEYRLLTSP